QITAVFMPKYAQLVICEAIVDLVDGSLEENILRIPYSKIVTVRLRSSCEATMLSERAAREQAMLFNATTSEQVDNRHPNEDSRLWLREIISSQMVITLTDGGRVAIPFSCTARFSNAAAVPLDRRESLTEEERCHDRVVSELNRMIESAALPPGHVS